MAGRPRQPSFLRIVSGRSFRPLSSLKSRIEQPLRPRCSQKQVWRCIVRGSCSLGDVGALPRDVEPRAVHGLARAELKANKKMF